MQIKDSFLLSRKESEDEKEYEGLLCERLKGWFDRVFDAVLGNVVDDKPEEVRYYYQIENIIREYKEEYQQILSETIQDFYITHSETVEARINHTIATKTLDNYIASKDMQSFLDEWLYENTTLSMLQEEVKKKLRYARNVHNTLKRYLPNHLSLDLSPTQFTMQELLDYEIDRSIIEYMSSNIFTASESTLERVTQKIYDIIKESYAEEGNGIDKVTEAITEQFNELRDFEAQRIARTETLKAQASATHQRLVNNPDVEYIQWIATHDDRTRDSHAELDGQITYADGTGVYSNGLAHPGDESGDIEEWINCRCDEAAFIPEPGYVPPSGADNWYEGDMVFDPTISVPDVNVELGEYLASWW